MHGNTSGDALWEKKLKKKKLKERRKGRWGGVLSATSFSSATEDL
jgi:hypothetical protein